MAELARQIEQARAQIEARGGPRPRVGLILGSGLSALADEIGDALVIRYEDIPNFPVSTVHGHRGELALGLLSGQPVAVMRGRFHFYEGYTMQQVVFPVRVLGRMGVKTLVLTNAAGSVNVAYKPGELDRLLIGQSAGTAAKESELANLWGSSDTDIFYRKTLVAEQAMTYQATKAQTDKLLELLDLKNDERLRKTLKGAFEQVHLNPSEEKFKVDKAIFAKRVDNLPFDEAEPKIHIRRPFPNSTCIRCHSTRVPSFQRVDEHVALIDELRANQVTCVGGCHGPAHPFKPLPARQLPRADDQDDDGLPDDPPGRDGGAP